MTASIHAACVGAFQQGLRGMDIALTKLAAHCEEKKIDPAVFLNARLYPDMFHFIRQVQIACDFAKMASARLAGAEIPSHPDTEQTLDELKARVAKVQTFIAGLDKAAVEAGATREVEFRTGPENTMKLPGAAYLSGFALPNFYFHASMAYAILRHNGLPLGKRDFMGAA
jgi:hypothetical protein